MIWFDEKNPMEEGRPLRLDEGRQQGFAINSQLFHSFFRDHFLIVHLPSSFVFSSTLALYISNILNFLPSDFLSCSLWVLSQVTSSPRRNRLLLFTFWRPNLKSLLSYGDSAHAGLLNRKWKNKWTLRFFCPRIVCGRLRLQYWLFYRTLRWSSAHPIKLTNSFGGGPGNLT